MTISGTLVTSNLYTTVATLKTRLGISDTTDDTTLGLVLSGVSRAIDGHCGQSFYRDAAASARTYTATDSATVFVDPLVSVTELATDDGDRTYATVWAATDYDLCPANAGSRSQPYTWIEAIGRYGFPTASNGVRVTAVWGWPVVPPAVAEAALLWAERIYKRKDAPFGIASFIEAGEMRLIKDMDPDVHTLLRPFVRLF